MSVIRFHETTTSTPGQFVAGLTDFGPGRSKIFANSADTYLKVHHKDSRQADVTEGNGGIWERLRYNWSDSRQVELTTTDSNVFGGASGYTYTLTRRASGTTDVDVVIVREGKNFKGRALSGVLGTSKRSLRKVSSTVSGRSKPEMQPALVGAISADLFENIHPQGFRQGGSIPGAPVVSGVERAQCCSLIRGKPHATVVPYDLHGQALLPAVDGQPGRRRHS